MRNSRIILCNNIKIDKEYNNIIDYTEEKMLELCEKNKVIEAENYSFIRANGTIQTKFKYSDCLKSNYIAFQNKDYDNKWFFGWIDDVIYKGENNTEIKYTIDSWSTFHNNLNIVESFVVREHVSDDTIGLHTIDENLDVGEVIEEEYEELLQNDVPINVEDEHCDYYLAIESTYNPLTKKDFVGVTKINGNFSGSWIFLFDIWSTISNPSDVENFLADTVNSSKIESIRNMFILPYRLVKAIGTEKFSTSGTDQVFENYNFELLKGTDKSVIENYLIKRIDEFKDFKPKNKKCFCYPYNYMLVSNNVGNNIIYKYENFKTLQLDGKEQLMLAVEMAVSIGASIRLVPKDYKNIENNYEESIPLAKFPTCSWAGDAFINWLTNNALNIGTQIVTTTANFIAGNVAGGAMGTANLIGQFRDASLQPSIVGGNNNGDVNFASQKNTFSIHKMRVKNEYLKIIDDYFTKYGYKVNSLKIPNLNNRLYWNYVQIEQSENIGFGNIPNNYMDVINKIFRNGVTIWHNHENIGNYSLDNSNK